MHLSASHHGVHTDSKVLIPLRALERQAHVYTTGTPMLQKQGSLLRTEAGSRYAIKTRWPAENRGAGPEQVYVHRRRVLTSERDSEAHLAMY